MQVLAKDLDVTLLVLQKSQQQGKRRGLAGPIGSEKAINRATLHAEVEVVEGLHFSGIMIGKPGRPDNGLLVHNKIFVRKWKHDIAGPDFLRVGLFMNTGPDRFPSLCKKQ